MSDNHEIIMTTPAGEPLAYSVVDAVRASGIGRTTLYQLMSSHELPQVKIGSRTLIRRVDLEDLLLRHVLKRAA